MLAIPMAIGQQKESLRIRRTLRLKKPLIFLLLIKIVVMVARIASQINQVKLLVGPDKKALIQEKARKGNLETPRILVSMSL